MSGLESVLIAAVIVFVLNAAGSFIEFNNRFVNAVVDTVLFAIVFGVLVHFGVLHLSFARRACPVAYRAIGLKGAFRSSRHAYLRGSSRFRTCRPRLPYSRNSLCRGSGKSLNGYSPRRPCRHHNESEP